MQHPYSALQHEYEGLLASMRITRVGEIDAAAHRLLKHRDRWIPVRNATGIPIPWMMASFEREASSDFTRSPAQGDRWDRVSFHVPKNRGPFKGFVEAALDAYHIDHTDKVGAENFTEARGCYEWEVLNGMGYRNHGRRSPYLWAGTNIQQLGKYTADGHWDGTVMDHQLGVVPMARRIIELDPSLAFVGGVVLPAVLVPPLVPPLPTPIGLGGDLHETRMLQTALNSLGFDPKLEIDGSYGKNTRAAVRWFQEKAHLDIDGIAGPKTLVAIEIDLADVLHQPEQSSSQ